MQQEPRPGSPQTLTGFLPNLLSDVARPRPAAELPQGICWNKGHSERLAKPHPTQLPLTCPVVPQDIMGQGRIDQLKPKAEDPYG